MSIYGQIGNQLGITAAAFMAAGDTATAEILLEQAGQNNAADAIEAQRQRARLELVKLYRGLIDAGI